MNILQVTFHFIQTAQYITNRQQKFLVPIYLLQLFSTAPTLNAADFYPLSTYRVIASRGLTFNELNFGGYHRLLP